MDQWGVLLRVQFPWQMKTHVGVEIGSEHLHRCYGFIQSLPPQHSHHSTGQWTSQNFFRFGRLLSKNWIKPEMKEYLQG